MENWRVFESSCLTFLNYNFGNGDLEFVGEGQSNSTSSDIQLYKNHTRLFDIESKMPIAQSGQFVLLDSNNSFVFSKKNKSDENKFSDLILQHINDNYDLYKNVSTAGIDIKINRHIFENWIINFYQSKNVKYVITKGELDYILFPLRKYGDYFSITATFRIKKSGSRDLSKRCESELKNLVNENFNTSCSLKWIGKKAYINNTFDIPDKTKLYGEKYDYQLNHDSNGYLVRILSNTNNANVIFSVSLNKEQDLDDIKEFIYNL